ncbi:hypothetical protein [Dyella sp. ASV21]|uniref:bestrophin-like domain n=1 Tax=Dyella sp. ASV21 TaxID=2795114 RepID=UPI0018ED635B|nr:hypothetical protein [Dyella sp. ASV21]
MTVITDHPFLLFFVSMLVLWVAGRVGVALSRWHRGDEKGVGEAFAVVQGATLTLLALIIGFTFSMSISRYDQRKNYEEAEANAIGTEYVRLGLLAPADAARARALLSNYLQQRILFYENTGRDALNQIAARKNQLQSSLWAAVEAPAHEQANPIMALVVAGMNDVLNAEGYTQAAWWNRIPVAAWVLMMLIAIGCNLLLGFGARQLKDEPALLLVLPLVVSISFMLIADIDSPRGGVIRVGAQNLHALAPTLR